MTENINRQPKGVPVGGQFAAITHSEAGVTLTTPAQPLPLADLLAQRDVSRERLERLEEQKDSLDRMVQAQSVRILAAAILEKYPNAATFRVAENEDGENQFDPIFIKTADGTALAHVDDGDDWTYEEVGEENSPYLQELVWPLNPKDDRWADGLGTVTGGGKRHFKVVDIDLVAARDAPLPHLPEVHDPYQRTFTEDEQKAVVDAAFEGVSELNDKLTERAGDYSAADLEDIQKDLDAATKVLHRADDI